MGRSLGTLGHMTATPQSNVADAEAFGREELAGMDGSHDWWHIHRVRTTALALASEERLVSPRSLEIVELAALLHDVRDWKYSGDADAGARGSRLFSSRAYPSDRADAVVDIVSRVGFKDELASASATPRDGPSVSPAGVTPEFACVQDADRLDAMGAIGIGRTFCYGGAKGSPMHVPGVAPREGLTREAYVAGGGVDTTVNHFHEKLLKLRGLMKTDAARRRAERRHRTMLDFLERFHAEWDGTE